MLRCYKTACLDEFVEFKEKHSRFLGFVGSVLTPNEASAFLENIKKDNRGASHYTYAYRLHTNNISKYSDDGEPRNTAGLPILEQIKGNEIFDCIIVVVRYFGGVLLGKGGLTRAYKTTAKLALEKANILDMYYSRKLSFNCNYEMFEKFASLISDLNGKVVDTLFSQTIKIVFYIKDCYFEQFSARLSEMARGLDLQIEEINCGFYPFEPLEEKNLERIL
jgi:uncharacterized YigZ family protein